MSRKKDDGSCGVLLILIAIIGSIVEIIKQNYILILVIVGVLIASYVTYRITKREQAESDVNVSKPNVRGYPRYSGQYMCNRDIKEGLYDIRILEGNGNIEVDGPVKFQKYMHEGQVFNNIEIYLESVVKIGLGMKVDFYNRRQVPELKLMESNEKVNEIFEEQDNLVSDMDKLEGHDFEYYCADILRQQEFENVEVTKGSGDQGVDIIAEKNKIKYAIQCKRYGGSVGNKAVQEIIAGVQYYHCNVGIVMTNNQFTQSAVELANETGIILWDGEYIKNNFLDNRNRETIKTVALEKMPNTETGNKDKKVYPPGMYIVGISIEAGGYIIKCRNDKACAEVWGSFEDYKENEPNLICAMPCGDDYFITLCNGQFMILTGADIVKY